MARTRRLLAVPALLAAFLALGAPMLARAEESAEIMGTTGSTSMTIEVLEQPDYDLVAQSDPKGQTGQKAQADGTQAADEPVYGDMPQTGAQASQGMLLACVSALGLFLVGLEARR